MLQWLNACDFDLAAYHPVGALAPTSKKNKPISLIVVKTNKK